MHQKSCRAAVLSDVLQLYINSVAYLIYTLFLYEPHGAHALYASQRTCRDTYVLTSCAILMLSGTQDSYANWSVAHLRTSSSDTGTAFELPCHRTCAREGQHERRVSRAYEVQEAAALTLQGTLPSWAQ